MRIGVQMDPIETVVVWRDTSFALMVEAQARGWELWWWRPQDLYFDRGRIAAFAHRVRVRDVEGDHYDTLESRTLDLAEVDVALIRQDPPFDMAYVANTYLLERAQEIGPTLVLNHPRGVRDIPEKLSTLRLPHLIAPTFVGRNRAAITAFAADFDAVVVKPSFFAGGEGVIRTAFTAPDFEARIDAMLESVSGEPLVVQEFLPKVSAGDKRVLMVDGAAMGAVRRMPKAGEFRANLHMGGVAEPATLDEADLAIAAAVAPLLREGGILLAGLDVIDGRLTEINVTSPTLVRQLRQFGGPDIAALFWDKVVARLHPQA